MNEKKFDNKGEVYVKARPAYPEALFWYLMAERVIDKSFVVADIGSGTGIFTKQISPFVKQIYAIEPNEDMRSKAEAEFDNNEKIISINATAEETSLSDKSVDLITVAQAFHWFDRVRFKKECGRILKKNGNIVLVWNDRDIASGLIRDNFEINRKYCPDFKGSSNGLSFEKEAFADFFDGEFDIVEFENSIVYDLDSFIQRNLSSSYAPTVCDNNYDIYVNELKDVFARHSVDDKVIYPYVTRCYIGKIC